MLTPRKAQRLPGVCVARYTEDGLYLETTTPACPHPDAEYLGSEATWEGRVWMWLVRHPNTQGGRDGETQEQ